MAFTPKSWQDHLVASFGQESETAQSTKDGLVVGGVYNSTPPTIADGEMSRLQVDASGNLMVNLTSADTVTVSVGTITLVGSMTNVGTIKEVTTVAAVSNLAKGTITELEGGTLDYLGSITNIGTAKEVTTVASLSNLVKGTITELEGGTLDLASGVGTLGSISNIAVIHNAGSVARSGQMLTLKGTASIATSGTIGTYTPTDYGLIRWLTLTVPDMTGTGTTIVELKDAAGGTIFASGDLADTAVKAYGTEIPMTSDMAFTARTTSGTQDAGKDILLSIHYKK